MPERAKIGRQLASGGPVDRFSYSSRYAALFTATIAPPAPLNLSQGSHKALTCGLAEW